MTTRDFINRLEKIRQKDKRYTVYPDILDLSVSDAIDLINKVDEQLLNEEIDNLIIDIKNKLQSAK